MDYRSLHIANPIGLEFIWVKTNYKVRILIYIGCALPVICP